MTLSMGLWLFAALLAVLGLLAWRRPARRGKARPVARLFGVLLLLVALALAGLGLALRQYAWVLDDVPLATIELRQLAPQRYRATLAVAGGAGREFVLLGDEWQLDARVLRWRLPAQLAGVPPMVSVERLSGRYGDPKQEQSGPRSVHDLRAGGDFWALKQRYAARLPLADARWGSAAYLPMLDGARYAVFVNPRGGLVAKPADAGTERLLRDAGW